jgi:hypothetical protein
MQISPEAWDLLKLGFIAYMTFILNRSDRNNRELFKRITRIEVTCAAHHGNKGKTDEDP